MLLFFLDLKKNRIILYIIIGKEKSTKINFSLIIYINV